MGALAVAPAQAGAAGWLGDPGAPHAAAPACAGATYMIMDRI